MAQITAHDEKIVFFSAYPEAKDELHKQIAIVDIDNTLIVDSGDEKNFIDIIKSLKDINKRIVLFKNIENYSSQLFKELDNKELIIYSGDIDKCRFREELLHLDFRTRIFFSYPEIFKVVNKIKMLILRSDN